MSAKRKYWGWGYEGEGPEVAVIEQYKTNLQAMFQIKELEQVEPLPLEKVHLRFPRFIIPTELTDICTSGVQERAARSYGKSFR